METSREAIGITYFCCIRCMVMSWRYIVSDDDFLPRRTRWAPTSEYPTPEMVCYSRRLLIMSPLSFSSGWTRLVNSTHPRFSFRRLIYGDRFRDSIIFIAGGGPKVARKRTASIDIDARRIKWSRRKVDEISMIARRSVTWHTGYSTMQGSCESKPEIVSCGSHSSNKNVFSHQTRIVIRWKLF